MKVVRSGSKIVVIALAVVAVLALAGVGYLLYQNNDLKNNPGTAQNAQRTRADEVKSKVAKLISVPKDETPTLGSVADKAKLKDQPFFKDAENGDIILIFPQAKKAIIYREKSNKLINVGPIAITTDVKGGEQSAPASNTNSTSTNDTTTQR